MAVFEHTTVLPHAREDVFAWFSRPGALPRLSPPFSGSVRRAPSRGIEVGSTAVLGIGAPGSLGLAAGAVAGAAGQALHLPGWARPELLWHARHTRLDPGRSFTDVMESGPLSRWEHTHTFDDATAGEPGTVMVDRIEFELPLASSLRWDKAVDWSEDLFTRELRRIFAYRERQLRGDLRFHALHSGTPRTIAVAGASGTIGTQLCALLAGGGHRVLRLVRRPARHADEVRWDPEAGELDPADLAACDAVVNLAGEPIGGRFTPRTKQRILSSRTSGTALLARTLATLAGDGRRRTFVCASGIGYYGASPEARGTADDDDTAIRDSGTRPLSEDAPAGHDFLANVCRAWEQACDPAREAGVRVVTVRTGLVQTPAGGILQRLLPIYLAGLGGPLGEREWQSWIGIDDIIGIHAFAALEDPVAGPVNAVAPEPVTAGEYAKTLARVVRRPAAVRVPEFGPRLLLGEQGARELAHADQRVSAAKIESLGYEFRHRSLESALRHVLGRS
ncbi:MAG: TIGR01777 family oxidoreductase [Arthrobacter sp.]|uniref:TIGR01777 family oxidoreductase n=1 Tax=Arthrobacter sp. TaxID=1667 RepID=UPI0034846C9C